MEEDGFTSRNMDLADPLDTVAPSEIEQPESMLGDPEDIHSPKVVQSPTPMLANTPLAASTSVIQLTAAGVRSFLGRTQRPRPLLRLVYAKDAINRPTIWILLSMKTF